MELVAIDIGGTHARFALATIGKDGAIMLGDPVTFKTSDFPNIEEAWQAFSQLVGKPIPPRAAIAIAGPVTGDIVRMTNNSWVLDTGALDQQLGIEAVSVMNDFAAVGHAVAQAPPQDLLHIAGPDAPLPKAGVISIVGPGTGLGVGIVHRLENTYHVLPTEGGHVDFTPVDDFDLAMFDSLRARHEVVCAEHVVSGPGIVPIYQAVCAAASVQADMDTDRAIWDAAFSGSDRNAEAALGRFCMNLGSTAGDFVLGHGANLLVLAGGLGAKLRDYLPGSQFHQRFCHKGPYKDLLASIPVKLITHPQPGLFGAAAAFQMEHSL